AQALVAAGPPSSTADSAGPRVWQAMKYVERQAQQAWQSPPKSAFNRALWTWGWTPKDRTGRARTQAYTLPPLEEKDRCSPTDDAFRITLTAGSPSPAARKDRAEDFLEG
ncbi:hypothetical protein PANDA_010164, partial [Ailuropoda melanoleuca]